MKYVMCSRCGKRVSNIVSEDIVVRAFVECPECIQGDDDEETDRSEDLAQRMMEEGKPCPCPFPEDDGTAKDCINKGHCGCILNREGTGEAKP